MMGVEAPPLSAVNSFGPHYLRSPMACQYALAAFARMSMESLHIMAEHVGATGHLRGPIDGPPDDESDGVLFAEILRAAERGVTIRITSQTGENGGNSVRHKRAFTYFENRVDVFNQRCGGRITVRGDKSEHRKFAVSDRKWCLVMTNNISKASFMYISNKFISIDLNDFVRPRDGFDGDIRLPILKCNITASEIGHFMIFNNAGVAGRLIDETWQSGEGSRRLPS